MKKIVTLLICILLVTLTSCTASSSELDNHLGEWKLTEISTTIDGEITTLKGGDEMLEPDEIPVSFIATDGETDQEITHYYGEDARNIKVGDHIIIDVRVFIVEYEGSRTVSFIDPTKVDKDNVTEPTKTFAQIKEEAENMEIPDTGSWVIQYEYHEYVECTVKEITKPFEMLYYPLELATLVLNEDGSGYLKYNFDYEGLSQLNLTWVRYDEELRITILGETGIATVKEDSLVFEQKTNLYGTETIETATFIRK